MRRLGIVALVGMVAIFGYLAGSIRPAGSVLAQQGDQQCFQETGKCVKAGFLRYWRANGALRQQGLPISDEMQEQNAADGKTYTVQYFERARFELHPEFAGTENEVLLGLLGSEQYKARYTARDALAPGLPPGVGTRENPVPIGTTAQVGPLWAARVVSVIPNANEVVQKTNPYNKPPHEGKQYFIAQIALSYIGEGSAKTEGTYNLRAVGPAGFEYDYNSSCGVVPERIQDVEVFKGGTLTGNACWEVLASDAAGLAFFHGDQKGNRVFLSLRP